MGEGAKAQFKASFPPIQSAIKRSGDGGGMRIQLDIPENQLLEAAKLMLMTNCVLNVTIEPDDTPNSTKSQPTAKY